jgi:hypothetical protein
MSDATAEELDSEIAAMLAANAELVDELERLSRQVAELVGRLDEGS